jgi:hypothetical protein
MALIGAAKGQAMRVLEDPQVWPNLSETATLLRVNKATLSRQATGGRVVARTLGLGRGQARVVPPGEVLRLAVVYRRVPAAEVVAALDRLIAARSGQQAGSLWPALRSLLAEIDPSFAPAETSIMEARAPHGARPAWWGALREPLDTAGDADTGTLILSDRAAPSGVLTLGPFVDDQPRVALGELDA